MSRAYLKCGHYTIVYSEDIVLVGDSEYCHTCQAERKVVRLPGGDQGIRVILTLQDVESLKMEIAHVVVTSNMHQELLGKLKQLEKIVKLHPVVIEERDVS